MPDELARRLTQGAPGEVDDLLAALLMAAEESFCYLDLADGTLIWSRGIGVNLGYTATAVGGRTLAEWRERVHPEDRGPVFEGVLAALGAGARAWTGDVRVARSDGSYAHAHVRAVVVRIHRRAAGLICALTFDTAPDDRAELLGVIEELRARSSAAERRSDIVAMAVSDAVYEWDAASDMVTLGAGWQRLFGYDPAARTGGLEWWIERVHPDDREGVHASFTRFVEGAGKDDSWVATYRFRCADGTYVSVRDRAYGVSRAPGGPPRIIGAMNRRDPQGPDPLPVRRLSRRQAEVLELVRAGHTSKEIATRLGIGEQAVKGHVSRLFERFGVPNRAALVGAADRVRIEVS